MLQQKNTAIESQRIKTQTKLSQLIEENKTGAGSPGVAAAAMLASVVVTVMYFAVQIAVTIFFVLLILLIPIIVIVSFLGIIITLLSGFAAAVDNGKWYKRTRQDDRHFAWLYPKRACRQPVKW